MKYVTREAVGILMNEKNAKLMGATAAFEAWDHEDYEFAPLLEAVGEFVGFEFEAIKTLKDEPGGYVTKLRGFKSGQTYVLAYGSADDFSSWEEAVKKLRGLSIELVEGSWSQLM